MTKSKTLNLLTLNNYSYTDENLENVKRYLTEKILPEPFKNNQIRDKFITRYDEFTIIGDKLFYKPSNLEVVYDDDVESVLQKEYDDPQVGIGMGIRSFYNKITDKYLNIRRDQVQEFIEKQPSYQLTKPDKKPINKPIISDYPNERWASDLVDMSTYSKSNRRFRYILTVIDYFTKYVFAVGLKNKTPESIIKGLEKIYHEQSQNTYPQILQTDNGGEYVNELFENFGKLHKIHLVRTMSYTPQSNGLIENFNGILRKMIREGFVRNNNLNWIDNLPDYLINRNHSKHSITKTAPYKVWRAGKAKVDADNEEPLVEVGKRIRGHATRKLNETISTAFEEGDYVRVLMSSLYSKVRKMIKAGDKKNVVVRYSPKIYRIDSLVKPRGVHKDFMKQRYKLVDLFGAEVLTEFKANNPNNDRKQKLFFGSEMMHTDKDRETKLSMKDASLLNKIEVGEDDEEEVVEEVRPEERRVRQTRELPLRERSNRETRRNTLIGDL